MSLNTTDSPVTNFTETDASGVSKILAPSERQLREQNKVFMRSVGGSSNRSKQNIESGKCIFHEAGSLNTIGIYLKLFRLIFSN